MAVLPRTRNSASRNPAMTWPTVAAALPQAPGLCARLSVLQRMFVYEARDLSLRFWLTVAFPRLCHSGRSPLVSSTNGGLPGKTASPKERMSCVCTVVYSTCFIYRAYLVISLPEAE